MVAHNIGEFKAIVPPAQMLYFFSFFGRRKSASAEMLLPSALGSVDSHRRAAPQCAFRGVGWRFIRARNPVHRAGAWGNERTSQIANAGLDRVCL